MVVLVHKFRVSRQSRLHQFFDRPSASSLGSETYALPAVLDVAAASAFLGVNRKTIYAAITSGDLPARRVGKRRLVILRHVLLAWLSQGRVSRSEDR